MRYLVLVFVGGVIVFGWATLHERAFFADGGEKSPFFAKIRIIDEGVEMPVLLPTNMTVAEALQAIGLPAREGDLVFPEPMRTLTPGTVITLHRRHRVRIVAAGEEKEYSVWAKTVRDTLEEALVVARPHDIVEPTRDTAVSENMRITLIRVDVEEKAIDTPIRFSQKIVEDEALSFRTRLVEQKGELGNVRSHYRILSHDGDEVSRTLLRKEQTKEPVEEIVRQGMKVKVGKKHTGLGTWYAWTGTLAAASPWLPLGSYARVTNQDNGKSVIVKINDRGPFGPNRIIDLDRVAFERIASLGAGIIPVTVEEVIN